MVMEQHPGMVAHLMVGWTGKRKIGGNLNRLRNTTLMEPGGGAQSIAQQPLNDSVIPGFLWPAAAIKFFTLLPVSLVDSMPTKIHILPPPSILAFDHWLCSKLFLHFGMDIA